MPQTTDKTFQRGVYVLLACIVLLVVWGSIHGDHLAEALPLASNPSELKAKAIDLYAANATTLSSYAMLVLTGVGFFVHLIFSKDSNATVTRMGKVLLICSVATCAASLLSGYFCYDCVVDVLGNGLAFDPTAARVAFFHQTQFWSFLVSIMIFGIFAIEALLN